MLAANNLCLADHNMADILICSCTFVSATVSQNYSDIGTIEIDAYIRPNTWRAPAAANYQQLSALTALMWFE